MPSLTSLYLAPVNPQAAPDLRDVRQVLMELQIIGEPLGAGSYTAGDGFGRHVVYAGCSPYLIMQPPPDGSRQFCHVALHGPYARPRLVTGPNTVAPRCPACRARIAAWRDQLADWETGQGAAGCSACGKTWSPHQLDWRAHAISGCLLVELRNVFPGEASPSDLLMSRLHEGTGERWRHAWAAYLER